MSFPTAINKSLAFGVPGEFYAEGPSRVRPAILQSTDAKNNVFGRAFSQISDHVGAGGSEELFAGILVNPKSQPMYGDSTNPLSPSMTLPNGLNAEFCSMGILVVSFTSAVAVGQKVVFDTTTGELSTVAPAATSAGTGKAFVPNCRVSHFTTAGAGPAVITLTN
ncbi:TPA: structural cement protein Gp24 [Escherichia coli]